MSEFKEGDIVVRVRRGSSYDPMRHGLMGQVYRVHRVMGENDLRVKILAPTSTQIKNNFDSKDYCFKRI